jgi:hypothetical protein
LQIDAKNQSSIVITDRADASFLILVVLTTFFSGCVMRKPTDNGIPSTLDTENRPKNRIQVSREAKSVSFFVNLTKKFLQAEEEVELSGLGLGE